MSQQSADEDYKRISDMLRVMDVRYPGKYSQQEIADFCGCSHVTISLIEKQAIEKLKDVLPEEFLCELRKY